MLYSHLTEVVWLTVVLYTILFLDEVQDITQAEIGLFFLASGCQSQSLFLAGDPAQAVAQGVDFRFEEVRSVVHLISGGAHKIPRCEKLFHNFRSHEGILQVANLVMDQLYRAFPGAAAKLAEDKGLVQGPRPGLLEEEGFDKLNDLLRANEKIRVLVRDDKKDELPADLKKRCFGVIEAKGENFQMIQSSVDASSHFHWIFTLGN